MQITSAVRSRHENSILVHETDPAEAIGASKAWGRVTDRSKKSGKPVPKVYGMDLVSSLLSGVACRPTYLASKASAPVEKLLRERVLGGPYKVLSFDVFDTLVLRSDKPEAQRYLELSERLRLRLEAEKLVKADRRLTAEDICLARVQALQVNYRIRKPVSGCVEGSIAEVIRIQVAALNLPHEAEALFLQEELDYEIENLSPNPVLVNLAKAFASQGGRVVLVSDMYLDGEAIEFIVDAVLGERVYERLYSSSDLVVSKRSGKIFKKVETDLGERPEAFIHFGDSLMGDVSRPREAGWSAQHFPVSSSEMDRRNRLLTEFVDQMAGKGFDVSAWAKI